MADLIRTGEAAAILGCSRQHVVDLADSGALPVTSVGSHRRLRRSDVERLARGEGGTLRREQERSRWLHVAVAGELVAEPDRVLGIARANLDRLLRLHPRGRAHGLLRRWERLLDGDIGTLVDTLVSRREESVDLRQNSPFAGVVSDEHRARILSAFAAKY
ncbi:MAG: DNA-binding protein [Actinobacteria bacterium]|nr:MAG: DNA-binding protein [Actinomycetota bacterium]